jgi:exodeoxyribonuclease III
MTQIKIASWNVNSVKARLDNLIFWLKESQPDIVLLQELKCVEEAFPMEEIGDLGYNMAINGQKAYNGVAILSKFPIEDVKKTLPNLYDDNDDHARYIEGVIALKNSAIRVASIYVPNGGSELLPGQKINESEKFIYKMNFFKRLHHHFKNLLRHDEITVFGGDYNVANPDEKKHFNSLLNLGYADSFRAMNLTTQAFSWWDYRGNGWAYNKGMRIDYLLTSPLASDKLISAYMEDKIVMDREKPSDHCPVICVLEV